MKILSALFAVLFLFITTSVAQLRYALENPLENPNFFISLGIAFSFYFIGVRFNKNAILEKINEFRNYLRLIKNSTKAYRVN
jgi:hypothetical protein